ncbi:unnamed protein product [Paramecium primaurelia]|uniref:Trichocyst matrix protein n=1 Tax=Paramecium primaurelia TaxID=5886 RepID=A0A8S1QJU3_PARPR|nr:unnamed protein product [Paramecium primaurelia]
MIKQVIWTCLLLACIAVEDGRYFEYMEIDKDEFGKTLIDTLEINISGGQSLEKVVDLMRNLEGQIDNEQKDDDISNQQFQKKCDEDLTNQESEINQTQLAIVEKQGKLDEQKNAQQRKKQIANAKDQWLKQIQELISQKQTIRNQEQDRYEQEMNENSYVISVISEVKKKFTINGINLIQINNHEALMDDLENAVDESRNFRQNTRYQELFGLFVQVAAKVKNEGADKLKSLCDELLINVSDNMSLIRKQEDKRREIFEKEISSLQKDLQLVQSDKSMIDAGLEQLENQISMGQNDLTDYNARIESKKQTKEDRRKECSQAAYEYKQSREQNDRKRQLVSQVIGLFSANQREFKEYLRIRND